MYRFLAVPNLSPVDRGIVIRPLEERPGAAAQLAEWFKAQWPDYHRGRTLGDISSLLRLRDVQQTLIAEIGGELVGTVAIRKSWSDAPDIPGPWLGGLLVMPEHRHAGIGMALVDAACEAAFAAGYPTIHVAIRDGVAAYEARGWEMVGTMMTGTEAVTVLKRLSAAQSAESA
jgi:GNAT superfamily N-acetyltransferase